MKKLQSASREVRGLALLLTVCLVFGLAQANEGDKKSPEKKAEAAAPSNPSPAVPAPLRPSPEVDEYRIGPSDVLAINVWREPEISRVVPVRPDGRISLPLIGEIEASGLTPVTLRTKIAEKLKDYLSAPEVTVIVQEMNSHKFNIVGEVLRPGSYPLTSRITVLDALAVAGGFRDFAKVKKIYVLRHEPDGSRTRIPFNYKEVIQGHKFHMNVELRSGDTVIVP